MSKKLGYIAGPFRGDSHWAIWQNITHAAGLALEVWRLGAPVICPHMNTFCFQGAATDSVWLDGDLEMLARCDFVLMTKDWRRSRGATAEHAFAIEKNIPIFYDLGALEAWLRPADVRNIQGHVMLNGD